MSLHWGYGSPSVIERELRDQSDMVERGNRLRAHRDRVAATTLDGTHLRPGVESFAFARQVAPPVEEAVVRRVREPGRAFLLRLARESVKRSTVRRPG